MPIPPIHDGVYPLPTPMMATLGARVTALDEGLVSMAMPASAHLHQHNGFVHAGAVTTLMDAAAGLAAYTRMAEGANVLTLEYKVNFLSPARGDTITAEAKVIKAGRRVVVVQCEAFGVSGGERVLAALMTASLMAS